MLSKQTDPSELALFLEHNREVFQFLLAFVQMSRGLKIGFIEVNFPPDIDKVIEALQKHPNCASIQFAVLRFADPDLRFLLEAIKAELLKISIEPNKKLVLILQGLEKSIAYSGHNPPILTNLNYARDAFPIAVPHPILFALPDYAVTRLALFAPDFWAWTSSAFKFQALPETRDRLRAEVSNFSHNPNRYFEKPEQGERIDLLERLLQEYPEETEASSRTRLELLNQLGKTHQSIREFDQAKLYFQEAIELSGELGDQRSEAEVLYELGIVYCRERNFQQARLFFEKSLNLKTHLGDRRNSAANYHLLGMVAQDLRDYAEARQNYQQALAIKIEFNDRDQQASTYHNLGAVAQELRDYEEARQNYQQALAIKIEFNDRYEQAKTYHQLGMVAQDLRDYAEARQNYQQALAIKIEFNDRDQQASTYHNLGAVAQELRDYEEARQNYQQALAIKIEFNDRYEQAMTYSQLGLLAEELDDLEEAKSNHLQDLQISKEFQDQHRLGFVMQNLSRLYHATQDQSLLEAMAKVLGTTVEEIKQALESN